MGLTSSSPAIQQPHGLQDQNTRSSQYASDYSESTRVDLKEDVDALIHRTAPRQFLDLQVLKAFGTMTVPGDEHTHTEAPWARVPATVVTGASAQSAGTNTQVQTQNIVITEADTQRFRPDRMVVYPDGTIGVVTAINDSTNTITVTSQYGQGLPLIATGEFLTDGGVQGADGQDRVAMLDKLTTLVFESFLEKVGPRTIKWDEIALQKAQNLAQTNYLQEEKRTVEEQLMTDFAQRVWLMKGGKYLLSANNEVGKHMHGIIPTMNERGSAFLTATSATVWDVLTEAVFNTNHTAKGGERLVFGTPRALHYLNLKEKGDLVRYAPNDKVRDLDLSAYKFGSHTLVPVEVQLWQDAGTFPELYRDRLVVIDPGNIKLLQMKGIPMTWRHTMGNRHQGHIFDYILMLYQAFGGVKLTNAPAHFAVDVSF